MSIKSTFMPLFLLFLNSACGSNGEKRADNKIPRVTIDHKLVESQQTVAYKTGIIPNELGQIMVLEYHLIGSPEDTWRRTPENFRKDLKLLYDHDFYPISVQNLASGIINVPAGKTPFVLTFDDSSAGQFRYLEKDGHITIDPDCAVGIMEQFKKTHKDFPITASFYVLPAIKPALRLFAQPAYKQQKLEWLIKNGYEIGNHGWYHVALNKLDDLGVQKHLAMFVKEIQAFIPEYQVKSLALPLGMHAKNRVLEVKGTFEGTNYTHEAVFLVGSAVSVSPFAHNFNRFAIQRVQAGDTPTGPEAFMKQQDKHHTRYISDGDMTKITAPENWKDKLKPGLEKKFKVNWIKASE
ncbi:MAG: polysaccharide deacetylase family protein [Sphingobacteriaceae bacterium]